MSKHVPVHQFVDSNQFEHFTAQNTPHGSLTKVFSAMLPSFAAGAMTEEKFSSVIAPAANDGNIFRSFATVWISFVSSASSWEKDEVWHTPPWLMAVRQFYVLARITRVNQGPNTWIKTKNNATNICTHKSHNMLALIYKCSTRKKNSTHESNNVSCIPFIEPLTPKSPLHYVSLNSGVFTLSLLHHKSGYTKSEPWAQDLRSPEPQFCPPSILRLQLLLSSDMDPLDPMGGKHLPDHVWNTSNSTSLPQCCNMLQHCENKICKKLTFIKTKKHILIHPTSMVAKSQLG